jgi:ankyrin repeat protein
LLIFHEQSEPTQAVQRTGASRSAQRQIERVPFGDKVMKTSSLAILVGLLVTQAIGTGQSPPDSRELERALQMQEAVLRKPDVAEVQRILKAGFDVNAPIGCGTYSALDGAVQVESMGILTLLLDAGAKPKGSALLSAARCRNQEVSVKMVEALLNRGADPNYKDCYLGDLKRFSMPLHAACYQGNFQVVQLLLNRPGIELNAIDVDGRTPLMWAVEKGHDGLIGLLLEKGADPAIKNAEGKTVADLARDQIRKREKILEMIITSTSGRYQSQQHF